MASRLVVALVLAGTAAIVPAASSDILGQPQHLVWPPPQTIHASGPPLFLHDDVSVKVVKATDSPRLRAAIGRFTKLWVPALAKSFVRREVAKLEAGGSVPVGGHDVLHTLELTVLGDDEALGMATDYSYRLNITGAGTARAACASIYGCMYALETFTQLVNATHGHLEHSHVAVDDAPDYAWRGLMIDAGRRFVPMKTLKNLLDTMAANKLNVLHLHASDECRFGVESKLYPNLTAALTGVKAGFYTQDDIKALIAYAGNLGIRVVPEFDIPGHAKGFEPLAYTKDGVQFCTDDPSRAQLYDDPAGNTYKIVHALMQEMAALFTDEVFNIGSDETGEKGRCVGNNTEGMERRVLLAIQNEFNKTPEGWEEVFFDAGAATMETIVDAWSRHTPQEITSTGRRAVESAAGHFYFTAPAPGGPKGWSTCWYDIGTGVPAAQKKLLLGGEMSMWTDSYCYITQCGAYPSSNVPVGAKLFGPDADAAFHKSLGGMIWPRGYVGAGAFWNYDATTDPSAPSFVASIWKLNTQLAARGASVCPTNCSCDQMTACGKPYLGA